jgi:bifunctional non-homologous end joining protein LigD
MPAAIEPMRAVTGELPTDDENWAYEIKWDGMRAIAFCTEGQLRLQSANGLDATVRFPELAELAQSLSGHRVVLDGEVVTLDANGRPDFGLLQPRIHVASAAVAAERAATQPVAYVLFDLLWLDGLDVTSVPYEDRIRLLGELVEPGPAWRVTESHLGGGADLLAAMEAQGMEGLIAKGRTSRYEPGRRSRAWRKLKVRRRQEFVVGGWLAGEGSRAATLGALLVGYHDATGALRYAGRVGTGFSEPELRVLAELLASVARETDPFDPPPPRRVELHARWVEPQIVVEVAFAEWTADGVLRHPSYRGRRGDKDPARVVREPSP